jgi:hypothetical protein
MRNFVDPNGTAWEVFEVQRASPRPESVRPGLEDGWLTFQSASEKRRLGHYPAGWQSLSDAELSMLCRQGLPVTFARSSSSTVLAGSMSATSKPATMPGLAELSLLRKRTHASGEDPKPQR